MTRFICPSCGANLSLEDEYSKDFVFCQYCGTKLLLDDYRSTHRIVDEARIKEAEANKAIKLKQLAIEEAEQQYKHTRSNQNRIAKIITVVIWILAILVSVFYSLRSLRLFPYTRPLIIIFGGGFLVFNIIFRKLDESSYDHAESNQTSKIRFPKHLEPFSEKNYQLIKNSLEASGFTNVSVYNMHDLTLGLFVKHGTVDKVTVNGREVSSGGRRYPSDADIRIMYHGR